MIKKAFLYLLVIQIVCCPMNATADQDVKAMFYDPDGDKGIVRIKSADPVAGETDRAKQGSYFSKVKPGIKYWIELVSPDAAPQRVSNDKTFQSDEKIRVHISTNSDGYLYILHAGSTGLLKTIPISDAGNGEVKIGVDYVVPSKEGWLRFDANPGEEKLKLLFAPLNSSDEVISEMKRSSADQLLQMYSKYIENPNAARYVQSGSLGSRGITRGDLVARDLIVEDKPAIKVFNIQGKPDFKTDSDIYDAPANYVVNTTGGDVKEPLAVEISLHHR